MLCVVLTSRRTAGNAASRPSRFGTRNVCVPSESLPHATLKRLAASTLVPRETKSLFWWLSFSPTDEYFLSNMQTIDGENEVRCSALKDARNWSSELWKAATLFPEVAVSDMEDTSPTCEVGHIEFLNHCSHLSEFSGERLDRYI